ncbi:SDR family NAD(P)-dependent oxidoreductase [Arthrobacter sp. 24S4-2]|uniref:SDR family NAD(P)-dependent oxidoreductase n=1 Tax=Arthrobacter sp. 24S4-2 TaxID=2575374 RepID=UPI0010C7BFA3|nr:SDR family NAD(P)-dependent oxidoreductase [Arthrobacter sp. 24S4-2]QCO98407.1 SDR family NAD(P)-dependent oxidoreductase [Arthrobacter sp. 24S4-2]
MSTHPDYLAHYRGLLVLVTGAEGFIGSTLVEELLAAGARVRALCHYKPYRERGFLAAYEHDDRVEFIAGDVRDANVVDNAVSGVDIVFHLAALIGIPYSYQAPDSYLQTNVIGTHNVLAACRRHSVRLVHTSTSEVYGTARVVPIPETHPLQPQSPYSASKIAADSIVMSYWHSFGTPVAICRPFNTYGPRQSARAVIPAILRQLHAGQREIRLGSLSPTRDFTFGTDTARGFLAIGASEEALGLALNLGTGNEISIGTLVDKLIRISGHDARVVLDDTRLRPAGSEVERLLADNTEVKRLTGWNPEISLNDGLARTWEWITTAPVHAGAPSYAR